MTGTQLEALVGLLADGGVEFVVVGGLAAVVHGSAYVTHDVTCATDVPPRTLEHSEVVRLFGRSVQVLTLEALILAKRAAGRRKDLLLLPELEALLDLKKPPGD